MAIENGEKRRLEAEIRQMEIDDVAAVYHLGEELFTSEKLPILYRTWDQYEVTDYFTSESDYCLFPVWLVAWSRMDVYCLGNLSWCTAGH